MKYEWWSDEDYEANDYAMLTSDEVYEHFCDTIGSYNEIEYNDPGYIEPEILHRYSDNVMDKMDPDTIPKIMCRWNTKYFNGLGFEVSEDDVKPFIDDLNIHERCHFIVEKPQGFIQFTSEPWETRKHVRMRSVNFEYLPRLERR